MTTRHRTTARLYLATCHHGCPLMLWAEEAVTGPDQARRAIADATATTPHSIDVQLLDRPDARHHYSGLNLALFRQGCLHQPITTRTAP